MSYFFLDSFGPPSTTTAQPGTAVLDLLTVGASPIIQKGAMVNQSLGSSVVSINTRRSRQVLEVKVNTAVTVSIFMQDATTGLGLPSIPSLLTINMKKTGLGFSVVTPTVTDRNFGWYDLALTASHTDTLGKLDFHITAPGALPNDDLQISVIAINKADAVRMGLSSLPNAAAGANTGLPVIGTQIPLAAYGTMDGLPTTENLASLTITGASMSQPASSAVISSGAQTLTYAATAQLDGTFHTVTDTSGQVYFNYAFNISAIPNSIGVSVGWKGYLNPVGQTITVSAYDQVALGYVVIGTITGSSDTVVYGADFPLFANSTSAGGVVNILFNSTGTTTFATDRVLVNYTALPMTATQTANAVLDSLMSAHSTAGSIGEGIALAAGLLQGNFYMDSVNNTDANGQTSARIRLFRDGATTAAATSGGTGQGEFATFLVTTTYTGVNKIAVHKVVRQ